MSTPSSSGVTQGGRPRPGSGSGSGAEPIPIIDAHVHLWDPRHTPRPASPFVKLLGWNRDLLRRVPELVLPRATRDFIGRPDYLIAPYLPPDYAADHGHHRVVGYVHVEASWTGRGRLAPAEETRWLESLTRHHDPPPGRPGPRLRGIVGAAALGREDLPRLLQAHRDLSDRFCGIRDKLAWSLDPGVMNFAAGPSLMGEAQWRRGFAALGDHDLVFDAWIYLEQAAALHDLLCAQPNVRVVLDHLATPIAAGGPFAGRGLDDDAQAAIRRQWREAIARLAEHPQVHAKLSGMFMPVLGWNLHGRGRLPSVPQLRDALAPLLEHAIACFGVERCMLASNFPVDKVSLGFERLYDAYLAVLAGRTEAERRALLHDNVLSIYALPSLPEDALSPSDGPVTPSQEPPP